MFDISKKQTIAGAFTGLLVVLFSTTSGAQPSIAVESKLKESVIAGGPDQFMEVRHVVIRGTNFEIGQAIGQIARKNGVTVKPSNETSLNRYKRRYMATHYPAFHERMKGVATAFGLNFEDDRYSFFGLPQNTLKSINCSAVFYPPQNTSIGHGLVSRNYDYSTGNLENPKEEIMDISARVAFPPLGSDSPENALHRTLWYALYDTQERSLMVKFYLGERFDPHGEGRALVEYSDFVEFKLAH